MINYEYPPLGGGGSNATKYLLEHFKNNPDVEIDLITSSSINKYYVSSLSSKITIYFIPLKKEHLHYWKEKEIFVFLMKSLFFSIKMLNRKKYDLYHAIFGFPSGMIPFLIKKYPYIVSLRGSDVPGFNIRFGIQYIFLRPLFRFIWRNASYVTVNSTGLADLAKKTLDHKNFNFIPNGIDMHEFVQKEEYRNSSEAVFHVLTVSRLIKRKRIEDLLNAIKVLISKGLYINLTVIGKGKNEFRLKELTKKLGISGSVYFKGYVSHSELPRYYNNADVFVLPSLNEGMSNTALEAMASGLPLILTNVGGTAELIKGNGFIVDTQNPEQIANALRRLYFDPQLNKTMGLQSREHANDFNWETIAGSYFQLYKKAINPQK